MNTIDKIKSYEFLPEGWDFGKGGPMSKESIKTALDINRKFSKFFKTEVFPGVEEAIVVCAYIGVICLEARIKDLTIEYALEIGKGPNYIRIDKDGIY